MNFDQKFPSVFAEEGQQFTIVVILKVCMAPTPRWFWPYGKLSADQFSGSFKMRTTHPRHGHTSSGE
jgi:hypothetical protein